MFSGIHRILALLSLVAGGAGWGEVRISTVSPTGGAFLTVGEPHQDRFEPVAGSLSLTAQAGSTAEPSSATLNARFLWGAVTYELELLPVRHTRVLTRVPVHAGTGRGNPRLVPTAAVAWISGQAQLARNGQIIAARVPVEIYAVRHGHHADDETRRMMPAARPLDAEVHLLVRGIQAPDEPSFLQVGFDDVRIEVNGAEVAARDAVPTVPALDPEEHTARQAASAGQPVAGLPVYPLQPGQDLLAQTSPVLSTNDGVGGAGTTPDAINLAPTPDATTTTPTATPSSGTLQGTDPSNVDPLLQPQAPLDLSAPTTNPGGISPLNASPGTPLPAGIPPSNASAATPLPTGISPLNSFPAAPLTSTNATPGSSTPVPAGVASPAPASTAPTAPTGVPTGAPPPVGGPPSGTP